MPDYRLKSIDWSGWIAALMAGITSGVLYYAANYILTGFAAHIIPTLVVIYLILSDRLGFSTAQKIVAIVLMFAIGLAGQIIVKIF